MKRLGVISSNITASLYSYWLYILWRVIIIFMYFYLFYYHYYLFLCVRDLGFGGGKREEEGGGRR